MDLVNEYLNGIHLMNEYEKEFEKKESVKKYNRLSDRNRKIASDIDTKYPELKSAFYELLSSDESEVRAWVAHHILEVMNYENECRKAAFEEIVRIAKGSGVPIQEVNRILKQFETTRKMMHKISKNPMQAMRNIKKRR